jgi:hypothetical protein
LRLGLILISLDGFLLHSGPAVNDHDRGIQLTR